MGLVDTLRAAMDSAIVAADDTAISLTYHHVTLGVYDPATDSRTDTEVDVTFTTFAYALQDNEVDWFPADSNMQKVIVNRGKLNEDAKAEDYVTIAGVDWEIARIKTLPGNVGYILFIRAT